MPRYAILINASLTTEGKGKASPDTLAAVGEFNEEMHAVSALLSGEGLRPTSDGYRVRFSATEDEVAILNGPFDLKDQSTISGGWAIKVKDGEEALSWAKRISRLRGMEEFNVTEEQKQREEALRAEVEGKQ
ncbi:hypothetical protein C8A05DRAFT_47780 [Staphylotrichum tortipilum]|uniref:YCII-related domain-containing protein n=1 Tax=Staphylotrichum tortipilum TaxID=2831512 RepID=A0AAN6MBE5_9PEZI|nr:hypothetical protein C8A05DRAFT_47780 [Staphylotrichum longicolle]